MSFWNKMKDRFKAESDKQMSIILIVFTLTGCTIAWGVRPFLFNLLGITDSAWYIKLVSWIIMIIPSYYVFLILYGAVFGEYKYFYNWIFNRKKVKNKK